MNKIGFACTNRQMKKATNLKKVLLWISKKMAVMRNRLQQLKSPNFDFKNYKC